MKAKVFIPSPLFYIMKITFAILAISCQSAIIRIVYTEAKKGRGKDDAQDTIQKCKRWWN